MCLVIMPEVLIKGYFQQKKFEAFRKTLQYSWLSVFGSSIVVYFMVAANLVGFSFGIKGLQIAINEMLKPGGLLLFVKNFLFFVFCVHFQLMLRREENKSEIKDKGF